MAVPVVFRVLAFGADLDDTPTGPTAGGNLVQIYGDGFRLPPAYDGTPGDTPQTVQVLFGDAEAPRVDVIRTNALNVLAPPSPLIGVSGNSITGPTGLVDITIRNLDDNGDPIPGEELVVSDAYTYRLPGITAGDQSILAHVMKHLLLTWVRDVHPNVLFSEHTEYDADTADGLNITEIAELPAIVLVGPDTPENRFHSLRNNQVDIVDGTPVTRPPPLTVDLLFDVLVIDDNERRSIALQEAARNFIHSTPYLEVPRDPSDPDSETIRFEMDEGTSGQFTKQSRPNNSNMKGYSGTLVVRGVDIEGPTGFVIPSRSGETVPEVLSDPEFDVELT